MPWSNVLANPAFGTIVSSSGSAFTWAVNSRENRLTPFANDPLSDPTAEVIYLRDDDSRAVWGATPGPLPRRTDAGRWVIRHGAGVTRYQHSVAGIEQELMVFVPPEDPVKLAVLTLRNTVGRPPAHQCLRVRRVVSRATACRRAPFRRHGDGRRERDADGTQRLHGGVRRASGVLASDGDTTIAHR